MLSIEMRTNSGGLLGYAVGAKPALLCSQVLVMLDNVRLEPVASAGAAYPRVRLSSSRASAAIWVIDIFTMRFNSQYALQFANLMSKCNLAPNQKCRKVALVLRHIYNEQN